MINEINVVIGSWGSYNACNERALGSGWLDFSEYDEWEHIEEELKTRGFELDGIDEELFVQDIEGLPSDGTNWDYVHPKDLFEMRKTISIHYLSFMDLLQLCIAVMHAVNSGISNPSAARINSRSLLLASS